MSSGTTDGLCWVSSAFDGDLNKYTLGRMLGQGGFGTAFLAEHESGMQCVVKLFHGLPEAHPDGRRRLELSLARLRTVQSAHVVQVLDSGIDPSTVGGPQPWIAMGYLHGTQSLDKALAAHPRVDTRWAHRVIREVALGLQALHRVGLLHRDLKPSNILVDASGHAWLIDFDLVKIIDATSRTPIDQRLGTLLWMAPEQTVGPVGPPADLWALGLVAHELLTGRHPLRPYADRGLAHEVLQAIASAQLVGSDVPAPYAELLDALLRKLPVARPQAAQDVVAWLDNPARVSLGPPPLAAQPGLRWTVARREEIDAVEIANPGEIKAEQADVTVRAREDHPRLRNAARRIELPFAYEPSNAHGAAAPSARSLFDLELRECDVTETRVPQPLEHRSPGAANSDFVLLPFDRTDDVGVETVVNSFRVAARHRDVASGAPIIGTLHCTAELLQDPTRALPLLAACSQIPIDGWRLWIDGLQPDCGAGIVGLVRDAAEALAESGRPVWVRASDVSRWAIIATASGGLTYRAGRGLWTRPSDHPRQVSERVEIDRLAGPVPRKVAERLAIWRPDILACNCRACYGQKLPALGGQTVLHNMIVVGRQLAAREEPAVIVDRLSAAIELREEVAGPVDWSAEIAHLVAVRQVVSERIRTPARAAGFLLAC